MKRLVDINVYSLTYGEKEHIASGTFHIRGEPKPTPWRAKFETRWNVTIDRELEPRLIGQIMQNIESVLGLVNLPVSRAYEVEI